MNDISPEARALLRAARDEFEASSEDRARIDRALTARLGLAVGAVVGATTATSVSAATAGATGTAVAGASGATAAVAAKWVAAGLLLAAAGAGGGSMYRSSHHAPAPSAVRLVEAPPQLLAVPTPAPSANTFSPPSDPSGTEPIPGPIAAPTARRAPEPSSLPAPPKATAARLGGGPDPTLGAETQLMRRADQALRIGDPARALALLDEHARTFPDGVFAEERSAERVTTLCLLGRLDQARTEAARFLAVRADSPLAKVVRESCGGVDPGGGPTVP